MSATHICYTCHENLPVEDFPKSRWICRPCRNASAEKSRKPDYEFNRRIKRHGLTRESYDKLIEEQDNRCGICFRVFEATPHIDHDHSCCPTTYGCGKCVRGLLCTSCNNGLGRFGDNEDTLLAAVRYLRKR